jgi:hypothetical protein
MPARQQVKRRICESCVGHECSWVILWPARNRWRAQLWVALMTAVTLAPARMTALERMKGGVVETLPPR